MVCSCLSPGTCSWTIELHNRDVAVHELCDSLGDFSSFLSSRLLQELTSVHGEVPEHLLGQLQSLL